MEFSHEGSAVDISIVVPIYNEQEVIPELHERLRAAACKISDRYEIIFINDGSRDKSMVEIRKVARKDSQVCYINFSRNFGHQIAVTAGLDACRGKVVVIIDGDLQDPPELIPEMYAKYKEGYDVVYAQRGERKGETFLKKVTAAAYYRILKSLTSIDIPLDTGDFRLIDRKIVEYLRKMPEQNKFIRGQIAWLGFKSAPVVFSRDERKYGVTGYSFAKLMRLALDGITGFSNEPLLFAAKLGTAVAGSSVLVVLYALYSYFIAGNPPATWLPLLATALFIGGIQLIALGILGEYISRVNKNTLHRPLYIVAETNTHKDNSGSFLQATQVSENGYGYAKPAAETLSD